MPNLLIYYESSSLLVDVFIQCVCIDLKECDMVISTCPLKSLGSFERNKYYVAWVGAPSSWWRLSSDRCPHVGFFHSIPFDCLAGLKLLLAFHLLLSSLSLIAAAAAFYGMNFLRMLEPWSRVRRTNPSIVCNDHVRTSRLGSIISEGLPLFVFLSIHTVRRWPSSWI